MRADWVTFRNLRGGVKSFAYCGRCASIWAQVMDNVFFEILPFSETLPLALGWIWVNIW